MTGTPFDAACPCSCRWQVLYDGDCAFCARVAAAVCRRDRRGSMAWTPYQSPPAALRGAPWLPDCREALHVVAPDGSVERGEAAVARVLELLGHRTVARVLRAPAVRPFAACAYRFIARNRRAIGRIAMRNHGSCGVDRRL